MAGLRAESRLTPADFHRIADERGLPKLTARKTGRIAARRAGAEEAVETRWNGAETRNVAQPGDYVVTALGADGAPLVDAEGARNVYVIRADAFAARYAPAEPAAEIDAGRVYAPTAVVTALKLTDGFDIEAPWGERQTAAAGYLILSGDEVYGAAAEPFEATYLIS